MKAPMSPLRTIIADDESLARLLMRASLLDNPDIQVIAECKNGRETVNAVQDLSPDLLFLDIHMPGIGGFDVVKELQSDTIPVIVFCTAHQRFALDIFDQYAVEYLLKPLDDELVARAVQRACTRLRYTKDQQERKSSMISAIMAIEDLMNKLDAGTIDESHHVGFEQPLSQQGGKHLVSTRNIFHKD